jgi:hypothetical protein
MKHFNIILGTLTAAALFMLSLTPFRALAQQDWEENGSVQVARISYIEGQLERYDPEMDEWVATVADAPVGPNDQLYAGAGTRAEILMPNDTLLRIGSETQVQIVSLNDQLTEIDLTSGMVRLYNNSDAAQIITATPYGHVSAPAGAAFDLSVGEGSVQVNAVRHSVDFFHEASGARKMVIAGSTAVVADGMGLSTAGSTMDRAWDNWNREQESLWADRGRRSGESVTYLPEPLHREAYVLDAHGTWQSVYYEGAYYRFWRPLHVGVHWAPFTVGAWTVWRGDKVWIPHEPFGYVTHHYGNWIYTRGYWYWAPPVTSVMVHTGLPLLHIGFGWYPGRVAWISTGVQVGWIPLAPYEPYYCHHPWGRRAIVVAKGAYPYHRSSHHYKHRRHTVMVHQDRLFQHEKRRHAYRKPQPSRPGPGLRPSRPRPPENRVRPDTHAYKPQRERVAPQRNRVDNPQRKPVARPLAPPARRDVRSLEKLREHDRGNTRIHPSPRVPSTPPSRIHPANRQIRDSNNSRFRQSAPAIRPKPAAPSHNRSKFENAAKSRSIQTNQRMVRTRTTVKPQQQQQRGPGRIRQPQPHRRMVPKAVNSQVLKRSVQRPASVHKKRQNH